MSPLPKQLLRHDEVGAVTSHRILLISDLHYFDPRFYEETMGNGASGRPPSRLSTQLALGDPSNPFHALLQLVRAGEVSADTVVCAGDLTTCADPSAMNLGWLQLHRLATELNVGEPIMTAGNHDIDSRFLISRTSPHRMLTFLDPPFPVADGTARASYWANGYCVVDRGTARFVLLNTSSLHGYENEEDRHLDHGYVPELVMELLEPDLARREPKDQNIVVCHHHPVEIDLPAEDASVMSNGDELVDLLGRLAPPGWMIIHGHRHLPCVRYAGAGANAPVVFSAGTFSADLHLRLQGRTMNQFYELELRDEAGSLRGEFVTWGWDQHVGEWRRGEETRAMPSAGGFGFRSNPAAIALAIEPLVPAHVDGTISWREVEITMPELRYLIPEDRVAVVQQLERLGVQCGEQNMHISPDRLRLGRAL